MAREKFYGAYDAAEYAASITDEWRNEHGEIWHKDDLCGYMSVADEYSEMDEDDEETYYFVDEYGAVGYTDDAEVSVLWIAVPTHA